MAAVHIGVDFVDHAVEFGAAHELLAEGGDLVVDRAAAARKSPMSSRGDSSPMAMRMVVPVMPASLSPRR